MEDEDYDSIRRKNIAERDAFFSEFFKDLKKDTADLRIQEKPSRRTLEVSDGESEEKYLPPRKRRKPNGKESRSWRPKSLKLEFHRKYNTRSRVKKSMATSDSEDLSDEDDGRKRRRGTKLKVLFPWAVPFERKVAMMKWNLFGEDEDKEDKERSDKTSDSSDDEYHRKKIVRRVLKSAYNPDSIPSPDEITEEQLSNIAEKSSGKIYNAKNGTSCHQCRQKTMDTKTVCRSGECIGVRGQFCGPCLRNRYGEEAAIVLKDPNWACPPCRGLCNCSICRTRNGQCPTGILAPAVQEQGYASVKEYLESAISKDA